jgi:hypothetical protein
VIQSHRLCSGPGSKVAAAPALPARRQEWPLAGPGCRETDSPLVREMAATRDSPKAAASIHEPPVRLPHHAPQIGPALDRAGQIVIAKRTARKKRSAPDLLFIIAGIFRSSIT